QHNSQVGTVACSEHGSKLVAEHPLIRKRESNAPNAQERILLWLPATLHNLVAADVRRAQDYRLPLLRGGDGAVNLELLLFREEVVLEDEGELRPVQAD